MVSADRSCTYLQLRCGPSSCAPRAAANRTAQLPCSMYPRRSSQCALARQPTRLAAPATAPPARAPAPDNAPLPLPLSSRPPPTLPPGQGLKTPVRAASAQASAASLSGKYRFAQSGKAAALARVTAAMRSSCTGKTASRARMCASAIRTSVRSVDADALQVRGGREGGGGGLQEMGQRCSANVSCAECSSSGGWTVQAGMLAATAAGQEPAESTATGRASPQCLAVAGTSRHLVPTAAGTPPPAEPATGGSARRRASWQLPVPSSHHPPHIATAVPYRRGLPAALLAACPPPLSPGGSWAWAPPPTAAALPATS